MKIEITQDKIIISNVRKTKYFPTLRQDWEGIIHTQTEFPHICILDTPSCYQHIS
jgi:hypothetical protein